MSIRQNIAVAIATLGGVGKIPKAPGTFGTLATLPLCYYVMQQGVVVHLVVAVLVFIVGTWAADEAARVMGSKDPSQVVVDEAAGVLLALVAAPQGWVWFCGGFILFRLFDIWKPWPVGWLDRNVSGGLGIMVDDVAAGGYAFLILYFISWWVR
ncbi:MAG: phosphatidylglycerophosphatase A [Magnetococcales bacterium]|nr:phosphatidylglycerophosphatase A [Magnetococcales bacterium]